MGGVYRTSSWKFMGKVMAALLMLSLADESSFDWQADECSDSSHCALNALQARASKSQSDDGTNDTIRGKDCCSSCDKFCSPKSGDCHSDKSKSYYLDCQAEPAATPEIVRGKDCCSSCDKFCSPKSGDCHSDKSESYYLDCQAEPAATPEKNHHHHGYHRYETNSTPYDQDRCEAQRTPQYTKCTGCPPMYKGKPCASTTRYNNRNLGACGCGNRYRADREKKIKGGLPENFWTLTGWTAALNCANLDYDGDGSLAWCAAGCGGCYKLCATGGLVQSGHDKSDNGGCGEAGCPKAGVCETFKIVDRCGDGFDQGKPNWCSQKITAKKCEDNPDRCKKLGNTNWYGYPAHFDLQDLHAQVGLALGWDNAEVTFEKVSCHDSGWDSKHKEFKFEECKGCPN